MKSLVTESVGDPLSLLIEDDIEKIFDLLEVRKEIEGWSAYYAAQRAKESDLALMTKIIKEMKKYFDAKKIPPNKLDADYHMAISGSSYNTARSHLMFTIYNVFAKYFTFLIENIFLTTNTRKRFTVTTVIYSTP